jgi:hypothetical protein
LTIHKIRSSTALEPLVQTDAEQLGPFAYGKKAIRLPDKLAGNVEMLGTAGTGISWIFPI